jgi:hypothetical protein
LEERELSNLNSFCSRTGERGTFNELVLRFLCAKRSTNRWLRRIYSPSDKSVPSGAYNRCATRADVG